MLLYPGKNRDSFPESQRFLLERKLINIIDLNSSILEQLNSFFNNFEKQNELKQRVDEYINQFECLAWQKIMELTIKNVIKPKHFTNLATISEYNNLRM